ncbi:MAG: leucine-rich repeat domain-containing protein [Candidatus Hodarchaeota archaeon]
MKIISQEFKINNALSLKFENNETWIYINEEKIEKYDDSIPSIELFNKHCTDLKKWYDNDYRIESLPNDLPRRYKKTIDLLERLFYAKEEKAISIFKEEVKRCILDFKRTYWDIIRFTFTKEDYLDLLHQAINRELYDTVHSLMHVSPIAAISNPLSKDDLETALNLKYEDIIQYDEGIKKRVLLVLFQKIALKQLKQNFKCKIGYEGQVFTHFRRIKYITIERVDKRRKCYCHEIEGLNYLYYLEWLKIIDFKCKQILEIKGIQELPYLNELELYNNGIESLEGIQALKNLERLTLEAQNLHNIEQLAELKNLKKLNLHYNQIENIEALQNLINLEFLDITSNPINNIAPVENLPLLKRVFYDKD